MSAQPDEERTEAGNANDDLDVPLRSSRVFLRFGCPRSRLLPFYPLILYFIHQRRLIRTFQHDQVVKSKRIPQSECPRHGRAVEVEREIETIPKKGNII